MAGANLITDGIVGLFNVVPVLGGALYGLICPPLVITGMHHLFLGVNLQMAGSPWLCNVMAGWRTCNNRAGCRMFWHMRLSPERTKNRAVSLLPAVFPLSWESPNLLFTV